MIYYQTCKLTTQGWSLWAPCISTSLNLSISTPRLFALWWVDGETSFIVTSLRKQRGDWSKSRFAFLSSSHTTIVISAENWMNIINAKVWVRVCSLVYLLRCNASTDLDVIHIGDDLYWRTIRANLWPKTSITLNCQLL